GEAGGEEEGGDEGGEEEGGEGRKHAKPHGYYGDVDVDRQELHAMWRERYFLMAATVWPSARRPRSFRYRFARSMPSVRAASLTLPRCCSRTAAMYSRSNCAWACLSVRRVANAADPPSSRTTARIASRLIDGSAVEVAAVWSTSRNSGALLRHGSATISDSAGCESVFRAILR